MRTRRIWIAAWLALAAPAAPWAMITTLTGHLAAHDADHAHPGHHHARAIDLALHGHPHSHDAPDHEHVIVLVNPAPPRGKTSLLPAPAVPCRMDVDLVRPDTGRSLPVMSPVHSPPPTPGPAPILRI